MKAPALAGLLLLFVLDAAAAGQAPAPVDPARAPPPLRLRLTGDVIKQAVRDTLAGEPSSAGGHGRILSGARDDAFGRQMDEARVPSCWRPDALQHQPAQIGPIALGGILALPFLGAAVLRGKCNP